MAQSYKTIKCYGQPFRFIFLFCALSFLPPQARAQGQKKPARKAPVIRQYLLFEKRYGLPAEMPEPLLQRSEDLDLNPETETWNDIYFDDTGQTLQKQHCRLRHRRLFSGSGQKQRLQLLIPVRARSGYYRAFEFKVNTRPDKGDAFTTLPFRKLLQKKDRLVADSLLKTIRADINTLEPVLEILHTNRELHAEKLPGELLKTSLLQFTLSAPEQLFSEILVSAELPATALNPTLETKMAGEVKKTEALLKNILPQMKPETGSLHVKIRRMRQQEPTGLRHYKLAFGITLLGAMLIYYYFRNKKGTARSLKNPEN